ncbi:MAG: hypothetical protein M3N37_04870 [Actinomycetota bacterium]|nr:hypothetical protein [Actinomycetota bacterium]
MRAPSHRRGQGRELWMLVPGGTTSFAALVAVRPAYLYDTRFAENLGMLYTTILAVVGLALTALGLITMSLTDRRSRVVAVAAATMSAGTIGLALWVASHDGRCVAGCGPWWSP